MLPTKVIRFGVKEQQDTHCFLLGRKGHGQRALALPWVIAVSLPARILIQAGNDRPLVVLDHPPAQSHAALVPGAFPPLGQADRAPQCRPIYKASRSWIEQQYRSLANAKCLAHASQRTIEDATQIEGPRHLFGHVMQKIRSIALNAQPLCLLLEPPFRLAHGLLQAPVLPGIVQQGRNLSGCGLDLLGILGGKCPHLVARHGQYPEHLRPARSGGAQVRAAHQWDGQ